MSDIKNVIGREKIKIDLRKYVDVLKNASEDAQLEIEITIGINDADKIDLINHKTGNCGLPLNSKYTFESMVDRGFNHVAYGAALKVAKKPGDKLNPLFIYGNVGMGKTHLLQAIGNEVLKGHPEKKVLYTTAENFSRELINFIRDGATEAFRKKYRTVDLLLMDDIQTLGTKERCLEEFFNTLDELQRTNKQIVVSCDCPPRAVEGFDEEIISRMAAGMVVDIKAPALEDRVALLQKVCDAEHTEIAAEVLDYIAQNIASNIGELEGGLAKVVAYAELTGNKITVDLATEALKGTVKNE